MNNKTITILAAIFGFLAIALGAMGAHALKFRPQKDERFKIKAEYGMQMDKMDHSNTAGMDIKKDKIKEKFKNNCLKNL